MDKICYLDENKKWSVLDFLNFYLFFKNVSVLEVVV